MGKTAKTQRLGSRKKPGAGGCRPRENWEGGQGRLGHRVSPLKLSPPRGPGPKAALRVHSGPKGTGRLLRSARVGLTARPRGCGRRGRGASGRVQAGRALCARAVSSVTNPASGLLDSTRLSPDRVSLLCRVLLPSGLSSAPNGPQLLLPH